MLDELEFMEKRHILMDKSGMTIIMNKKTDDNWHAVRVMRDGTTVLSDIMNSDSAYEYYKASMESFGFKKFTVIID